MNNFYTALYLANLLFGTDIDESEFEEIGLIAWNQIGNKRRKLYRYCDTIDCTTLSITLPCNADRLEAVTLSTEDWRYVTNYSNDGDIGSNWTEHYIESRKILNDPLYLRGKYVEYERVGNKLFFDRNYGVVHILYKGYVADENGLPELTEAETNAIALFVAYTLKYKLALENLNLTTLAIAKDLKRQWNTACDQARCPEYLNQNDMDEILDAKTSWNRKSFGKSLKPLR